MLLSSQRAGYDRTAHPCRYVSYPRSPVTTAASRWSGEKPRQHSTIVDYRDILDGKPLGLSSGGTSPASTYINAFYADITNAAQVRIAHDSYTATGLAANHRTGSPCGRSTRPGNESGDSQTVTASTTPVSPVFDVADYGAVGDGRR